MTPTLTTSNKTVDLATSAAMDAAAKAIWDSGSIKIADDLENGTFPLQIHRKAHPNAPLSPIYLSLRPEGVKDGGLTPCDFACIGQAMILYANHCALFDTPRYVAGIPAAGEPFLAAIQDQLDHPLSILRPLKLQKIGTGDEASITGPKDASKFDPELGQNVLLVDDLVTAAGTKLQAIEAIRDLGGTVTDLLVFLDRSGGAAAAALDKVGVRLHAVWDFDELLEFWYGATGLKRQKMSRCQFEAIAAYPKKLRAYIKAHS